MNQLFPIIRRQRRPLLPADEIIVGEKVEPPKVEATGLDGTNATDDGTQAGDENVSTSSESR